MAVVYQQRPDSFTPSGNKMNYQVTSNLLPSVGTILFYECEVYVSGTLVQRLKLYPFPTDGKQTIFDISQIIYSFGTTTFKPFDYLLGDNEGVNVHTELITNYRVRIREVYSDTSGTILRGSWNQDDNRRAIKGKIDEISIAKWWGFKYYFDAFVELVGPVEPSDIKPKYLLTTFPRNQFKTVYEPSKEFIYWGGNLKLFSLKLQVTARIYGIEYRFLKYDTMTETAGLEDRVTRFDVSPKELFTEEQLKGLEIYEVEVQLNSTLPGFNGVRLSYPARYQYKQLNCIRQGNYVNMFFLNRFGCYENLLVFCPSGTVTTETTEMQIQNYKRNRGGDYVGWEGDIDENEFVFNISRYYLNTKSNLEYEVHTNNLDVATQRWLSQIMDSRICYQSIVDTYYIPCQLIHSDYTLRRPELEEGENIKTLRFRLNEGFNEDYLENVESLTPSLPIGLEIVDFTWSID